MKASLILPACLAAGTYARSIQGPGQVPLQSNERFLVELSPGNTRWITEDEKWELRKAGQNFFDITNHRDFNDASSTMAKVKFPSKTAYNDTISPMIKKLEKDNMRKHLEKFTSFHTRYYKSTYGAQSSSWLLESVTQTLKDAGALDHNITAVHFPHPWGQNSLIVTIPGKSEKTVVIGAHQDSINLFLPSLLAAPGADDDGSGTVTIWEALRVLLTDKDILAGKAENTLEFQWYSAEEGGLLGSQAIFQSYQKEGRDVKAMLQQDMTGYVQKTIDAGEPESVGVITDFVDPGLTEFIKEVITDYCDIPFVLTKCGYACSDHASASKAGYPSAFVIESDFKYSDNKIHTTEDKIEYLSFDHMLQHAKLTLALAYELAYAKFE
ncbi:Zn-dependent exopeptidase [Pseudovirgaria hyperparasitica]|uniref:Peptide hydrolase n=1 Tax=Pseudovirgaria hyperparasitica TaxID=470096 RepID=A0A6A6WL15_9PEZI|nr:Zn-dependent exopeptidase [Pseudovirgaria hyperparasitica]KAF2762894.1 Zn-dependent exopeptidase [Pseudovirgaria hyperparasitica]